MHIKQKEHCKVQLLMDCQNCNIKVYESESMP